MSNLKIFTTSNSLDAAILFEAGFKFLGVERREYGETDADLLNKVGGSAEFKFLDEEIDGNCSQTMTGQQEFVPAKEFLENADRHLVINPSRFSARYRQLVNMAKLTVS